MAFRHKLYRGVWVLATRFGWIKTGRLFVCALGIAQTQPDPPAESFARAVKRISISRFIAAIE